MATDTTQKTKNEKKIFLSKENVVSISGGTSQIGVFFDGTGNNMNVDIPKNAETNVVKLSQLYKVREENKNKIDSKVYRIGVGSTTFGSKIIGGAFGAGAASRILSAYEDVSKFLNQPHIKYRKHKVIDVFGFSRGAACARHFVNMVKYEPFEDLKIPGKLIKGVKIRFLGIYDTVSSFGLPGNDYDYDFDFHVDSGFVTKTVHYTAEHERRTLFDLTSIKKSTQAQLPANMIEKSFPGVHSDIGGGYQFQAFRKAQWMKDRLVNGKIIAVPSNDEKYDQDQYMTDEADRAQENGENDEYYVTGIPKISNHISRIPLREMYNEAVKAGLVMYQMEELPIFDERMKVCPEVEAFYQNNKSGLPFDQAMESEFIHDSRYFIDKIGTAVFGDDNIREIYYPNADPVIWKIKRALREQEEDPDYYEGD